MDRYSNEAARALIEYFTDDETPEHVQRRMTELEKLARDQHRALRNWQRLYGADSAALLDLDRRACELLDLDPPGFDPATEGP